MQSYDRYNGYSHKYFYDILDRFVIEKFIGSNRVLATYEQGYDEYNRIDNYKVEIGDLSEAVYFVYGEGSRNNVVTDLHGGTANHQYLSYSYDDLLRRLKKTLATGTPFVTEYTYEAGRQQGSSTDDPTLTTTLIKTVKNGNDTLEYTYDQLGNITQIKKNGTVVESYTYDSLNQLKTVTRGSDTWEYTYDNGGNILSVKKNGVTEKSYVYNDYDWKDLLTSFNGDTIEYDAIGNPIYYRDGFSFEWDNERNLTYFENYNEACEFTYDQNGLRTSKSNYMTGEITDYYWLNGQLYGQYCCDGWTENYLTFFYDESGRAYGFLLDDGTTEAYYYYIFNAQGDIIGIVDNQGVVVVEYTYSAWGEILSITGSEASTIGRLNPLRYRGYYYDNESGFYYLQSRYYDPVTGRFISADDVDVLSVETESLLYYNLFSYCWNNPVNMADDSGYLPWFVAAAVGGALFDTAAYLIGSAISGQKITWAGVGKAALTGAVTGVAFGAIGKGIKAITSAVKATKTARKFADAGIRIINQKYASKFFKLTGNLAKKYGKGIKFNKFGFPDFSKFAKHTTKIKGLTGNYAKDAAMANKIFGLKVTPKGYTWHHVEDGLTMMLIPTDLHQAVRHTGGAALIKSLFGG